LRRHHVDLLRRSLTVVEQVQYLDGEFLVAAPESAAGRRSVALPRLVAAELDSHLRAYAEPATDAIVFESPEGGYLRFGNFRNRFWAPAVKDAGLAPLRPHDLRHTCASLATGFAAGADIKVLQRMLGHSSAVVLTLDRYGHLFPGQAESVADRLDEMAQAAGIVHRAEVVAIDLGRS
jgi:integrase